MLLRHAAGVGPAAPANSTVPTWQANPRSHAEAAAAAERMLVASLATQPLCRARLARSPERSACRSISCGCSAALDAEKAGWIEGVAIG